jgi:hypothetical protein
MQDAILKRQLAGLHSQLAGEDGESQYAGKHDDGMGGMGSGKHGVRGSSRVERKGLHRQPIGDKRGSSTLTPSSGYTTTSGALTSNPASTISDVSMDFSFPT